MTLVASLVTLIAIALTGIARLKAYIPEWNARMFQPMEHLWGKTSKVALGVGLASAVIAYISTGNALTSTIIGTIFMFSVVVAFSDLMVRKVPSNVSSYMVLIGAVIMFGAVLAPDKALVFGALQEPGFFPRVPTSQLLNLILGGIAVALIGLLGFAKIRSFAIAKVFLLFGQIGAFLVVFAPTLWAAYSGEVPPYIQGAAEALIPPLMAVGIVWAFDWAAANKIGGADVQYMYFIALTMPLLVGPGVTLWAITIAMPVQLVVHALGAKLGLGELRKMKNGPISQMFENRKAKRLGIEPVTEKKRRAIAFLPTLTTVVIIALAIYGM